MKDNRQRMKNPLIFLATENLFQIVPGILYSLPHRQRIKDVRVRLWPIEMEALRHG
jgi:hypothetical protein